MSSQDTVEDFTMNLSHQNPETGSPVLKSIVGGDAESTYSDRLPHSDETLPLLAAANIALEKNDKLIQTLHNELFGQELQCIRTDIIDLLGKLDEIDVQLHNKEQKIKDAKSENRKLKASLITHLSGTSGRWDKPGGTTQRSLHAQGRLKRHGRSWDNDL